MEQIWVAARPDDQQRANVIVVEKKEANPDYEIGS